jgi:protease I
MPEETAEKQNEEKLKDRRIAILATDGFEESELFDPKEALEAAGAKVEIVSIHTGRIKAWKDKDWGRSITVDKTVHETQGVQFDALVIPGGVMNPDQLRMNQRAVDFVREFVADGKSIASICHGPQLLIEAGIAHGKHITSWPSLKTDLRNAGAEWEDAEVVVDQHIVTSRSPKDIPAFNQKMIEEFSHSARRI